jgi:hypothetical protein
MPACSVPSLWLRCLLCLLPGLCGIKRWQRKSLTSLIKGHWEPSNVGLLIWAILATLEMENTPVLSFLVTEAVIQPGFKTQWCQMQTGPGRVGVELQPIQSMVSFPSLRSRSLKKLNVTQIIGLPISPLCNWIPFGFELSSFCISTLFW